MMIADLVDMEDLRNAFKENHIAPDVLFQDDNQRIEDYLTRNPNQKAALDHLLIELDQKAPLVLPEVRAYLTQWKALLNPAAAM
jgi:hypothetical protein